MKRGKDTGEYIMQDTFTHGLDFQKMVRMGLLAGLLAGAGLMHAQGVLAQDEPLLLAAAPAKPVAKATKPSPVAPAKLELDQSKAMATVTELDITIGRSNLVNLTAPVSRISVGNPAVADVILTSPSQVYVLGKTLGSTNVMLWDRSGRTVAVIDVNVSREFGALNSEIRKLVANKGSVRVRPVGDAVVLEGRVSDSRLAARVSDLAEALAGKKVINMLAVDGVHQVMLEVKIAEIRRDLADKLGIDLSWTISGGITSTIVQSSAFSGLLTQLTLGNRSGTRSVTIDAEKKDDLVKILAEPNIVAMSGQEGSFLAGGEIMIPVTSAQGTTTLETKEFGVGLRFTPTVLEDGRISLRVFPEVTDVPAVSNIGESGSAYLTLSTRRASTTVELRDGQSLAIGGLLQNDIRETVRRLPILGEIPILGVLFRSSEFINNKTELMIVVTPRLIKPLAANYALPTDGFIEPNRTEFFLEGRMEGRPEAAAPAAEQPAAQPGPAGGHQLK